MPPVRLVDSAVCATVGNALCGAFFGSLRGSLGGIIDGAVFPCVRYGFLAVYGTFGRAASQFLIPFVSCVGDAEGFTVGGYVDSAISLAVDGALGGSVCIFVCGVGGAFPTLLVSLNFLVCAALVLLYTLPWWLFPSGAW